MLDTIIEQSSESLMTPSVQLYVKYDSITSSSLKETSEGFETKTANVIESKGINPNPSGIITILQ